MRKKPKGGQQIIVFVNTEQYKILKALADAQEYPATVTKVARKLLHSAIADHASDNPA